MMWRCLTVRQPWAWAIAHGGKTIENRTGWVGYRGPIAIHAGQTWSTRGSRDHRVLAAAAGRLAHRVFVVPGTSLADRATQLADEVMRHLADQPRGAIIAVADLVDCHPDTSCCRPWGESSYTEAGGRERTAITHWVLERICPLEQPIDQVGRLGLWTADLDLPEPIRPAG